MMLLGVAGRSNEAKTKEIQERKMKNEDKL